MNSSVKKTWIIVFFCKLRQMRSLRNIIQQLLNQKQTLSMNNNLENCQYCFWDIRSTEDFYVAVANLVFASATLLFIIRAYFRSRKALKKDQMFYIYYFLALWYLFYIAQYIYGLVAYKKCIEGQKENFQSQLVVLLSVIFEFLDSLPAFFLIGCLYFICFHLYLTLNKRLKRIHTVCSNIGYNPTKSQLYFYTFLKNYQKVRPLYLIPTFLLFFVQSNQSVVKNLSLIQLSLFIVDLVFCNLVLFKSLRTVQKKNRQVIRLESQQDERRLKIEGYLLQLTGIIRFATSVSFLLFGSINSRQNCCLNEQNVYRTVFYMVFGQIFEHFLPVGVILYMFRLSDRDLMRQTGLFEQFFQ